MFVRGLTGRCAVCAKSRMSMRWLKVAPRCPRCDFPIERKEGHFVGAVGINTIVTFAVMFVLLIAGTILTSPDIPVAELSITLVVVVLVFTTAFFPISKTLWSAIDLMMIPLEPGEVDPRYDPTFSASE